MKNIIFHIDVNSAFLSWEAVYRLFHRGSTLDLREIPSAVGGDVMKVEDEDGEIRVIKEITVHSQEMKRYAGSPSLEFDCTLWLGEQKIRAWLIYYMTQSRWVLNYR